jgi:hypothetical protein
VSPFFDHAGAERLQGSTISAEDNVSGQDQITLSLRKIGVDAEMGAETAGISGQAAVSEICDQSS